MANSLDITERCLPELKVRGCAPTFIPFAAYMRPQVGDTHKHAMTHRAETSTGQAASLHGNLCTTNHSMEHSTHNAVCSMGKPDQRREPHALPVDDNPDSDALMVVTSCLLFRVQLAEHQLWYSVVA